MRKPAVAGSFYPSSPVELTKTIAKLFSEVDKVPLGGRPLGLISPHAGYPYSGRVAAKAYKLLEGEEYETVVVISPSHTVFFKGSSVFEGSGYQTPIGTTEIDQSLSRKIASIHPLVYFSNMGHASGSTRGEHSLEVQLPFLQIALGKFKLVAIVMGDREPDSARSLGEALAASLRGTNTLLVASTDLSHYHSEKTARRLDFAVQAAIEKFDPELLMDVLESDKGEACGGGAVTSVLWAARKLGAKEVRFLDYATSGAVTGDFDEVVGYLSAVVIQGKEVRTVAHEIGAPAATAPQQEGLTDDDRKLLHEIARKAIAAKLANKEYTPPTNERLSAKRGVFVTLSIKGELRGCIGLIRAREPLSEAVAEMALAAAFDDPRFDRLSEEEYEQLGYEISILSPLERVHDFNDIKVGRDGLMIKLDMHSGLLLPQVATEYGWNAIEFLQQTCLKAGLPKNSYRDKHAEIYRFSADVF
ncbi:MAG TPA: AmmeMemoRadiSam system protein B [Candidatus Acidoferrum sp.]|nr:AmmeMemoRadiSam system protein B [Candidatus Acidoferrum sp.]